MAARRTVLRVSVAAVLFGAAVPPQADARDQRPDDQLRQALVGSWIVPSDSPDRTPENSVAREVFRPDGTYTTYFYTDATCAVVAKQIEALWSIDHGIIWTVLPPTGPASRVVSRDEIVSLTEGILVLHSLDDGSTFSRAKAPTCAEKQS